MQRRGDRHGQSQELNGLRHHGDDGRAQYRTPDRGGSADHHHGEQGRGGLQAELGRGEVLENMAVARAGEPGDARTEGEDGHFHPHRVAAQHGQRVLVIAHGGKGAAKRTVQDGPDQPQHRHDREQQYAER